MTCNFVHSAVPVRGRMTVVAAAVAVLAMVYAVRADTTLDVELKDDVVLRALVDELQRSHAGLHMADLKPPYFTELGLTDSASGNVTARLGTVTGESFDRGRGIRTDVRVGSYQLDNSNYEGGGYYGGYYGGGGGAVPIEDDYTAIRQAIWWLADRDYKNVTEQLERKKAFMQSKMIEDKPDDFSKEAAVVYFEPRIRDALPQVAMRTAAIELSRLFRDFPDVQNSGVAAGGGWTNQYLVNTEGTRIRTGHMRYFIRIGATVQADDGMKLSDSLMVTAKTFDRLPHIEELTARVKSMVERLMKIRTAPKLESYTGPVLFDPVPATQFFVRQMGYRFSGGQRPVGGETSPDDFERKLGQRILPRSFHIVDDPTLQAIDGKEVAAHYEYDDQGVKAQRVSLVEGGFLKGLLMSRNPSKKYNQSNGHGRGSYGASAGIGAMVVTCKKGVGDEKLKQRLIDACKEEELEFGIRISSFGGGDGDGAPLAVAKVYPDGREEYVRGVDIAQFELNAFKHILAAGDKLHVWNNGTGVDIVTIAAPALLFEEATLGKIDYDFDKPPFLPSPLATAAKGRQ